MHSRRGAAAPTTRTGHAGSIDGRARARTKAAARPRARRREASEIAVRRVLAGDRWAAAAGARLVEVREGYARTTLRLGDVHLNGVEVAQGGAIFTLADYAFAACSNSHGTVAVALDSSITFVRAAVRGVLTAEALEESRTRRTSVCSVRVTDDGGSLVALFRGTAFRKDDPLDAVLAARRARPAPRRQASSRGRRKAGRSP
jgi:acyl-CoA thioesterase